MFMWENKTIDGDWEILGFRKIDNLLIDLAQQLETAPSAKGDEPVIDW